MMKILNIIIAVTSLLPCVARAAVEDSVLVQRVLDYYESSEPERMMIHTGRDEFRQGEKVSFRAYVVSEFDRINSGYTSYVYLDLYRNADWQRIMHKKFVRNERGAFSNGLYLPDYLQPGDYTIVGYTQQMLGFPAETYAYKRIRVTEGKENPGQFYLELSPEGGHFVEGATQKVGVRVRGDRELTGTYHVEVVDSAGTALYSADTDPYGYAEVKLLNDSLTPLRVNAVSADGYVLTTEVPRAETDCVSLQAVIRDGQLRISTLTHGNINLSELNVVIRGTGAVLSIPADRAARTRIPLDSLPTGEIIIDIVDDARKQVLSTRRIHFTDSTSTHLAAGKWRVR